MFTHLEGFLKSQFERELYVFRRCRSDQPDRPFWSQDLISRPTRTTRAKTTDQTQILFRKSEKNLVGSVRRLGQSVSAIPSISRVYLVSLVGHFFVCLTILLGLLVDSMGLVGKPVIGLNWVGPTRAVLKQSGLIGCGRSRQG